MPRTAITAALSAAIGAAVAALVLVVARPMPGAPDPTPAGIAPAEATITLEITVIDELTGEPVAGRIQVDDQVIGTMTEATVKVPANVDKVVTVTAPGYEVWKIEIRPHVKSDKRLTMPVRLVRRQPDL